MTIIFTNSSNDFTYRYEATEQEWDFLVALNTAHMIHEDWSFRKFSEIEDLTNAGR